MEYSFEKLSTFIEKLKNKLNIAVVYAGDKQQKGAVIHVSNNTRPWKSYEIVANDICQALINLGFKNTIAIREDINLIEKLQQHSVHLVWLNTGGVQGYNPTAHAPSLLELAGVPYIGHNPLLATILDNKHCFKRELLTYGIPTPRYMVWDMTRGELLPNINFRFRTSFGHYYGPFIVKPVSGRASIGVEVVDSIYDLAEAVSRVNALTHNHVLIEEYLDGPEYCVSVCSNVVARQKKLYSQQGPFVFSEIERQFEEGERIFTSMDIKPINNSRARLLDSQKDTKIISQLRSIASTVFLDFDIHTLIRIDLRANGQQDLFVLEANPKPDLKRFDANTVSLVAMGLEAQTMSYEDLILSLLAARLDYLFTNRNENIAHILDLL